MEEEDYFMAHRPRWQSLSSAALAVLLISACSSGTPATTKPSTAASAAATPGASTAATPGSSTAATPGATAGTSSAPSAAATAAPQGTAYPSPATPPGDPSAITNAYPNYGEEVDCDADSWNGLPYTGNLKSLTAPDDNTVVFTFCNPTSPSFRRLRSQCSQ